MNEIIFSSVFPFWDKLDDDDKTAIKDGHITKTFEKGSVVHRSDMGCQGAYLFLNIRKIPIIIDSNIATISAIRMNLGIGVAIAAFISMTANSRETNILTTSSIALVIL